jgi:peptide deformylase
MVVWDGTSGSVLRQRAQEVPFPLSPEDSALVQAMKDKIVALGGVGLAANQIGALRRVMVVYVPEDAGAFIRGAEPCEVWAAINPSWEPAGDGRTLVRDFEGCYSVQGICGEVPRYPEIRIRYQTEEGKHVERLARGFEARIFQHETDHLDGILFLDRMTPDCWRGTVEEMRELRRSRMSPEERAACDAAVAREASEPE